MAPCRATTVVMSKIFFNPQEYIFVPRGGSLILTENACYIAAVFKTVQYWWKDRHFGQWNRKEPTNIPKKVQMIFDKGTHAPL